MVSLENGIEGFVESEEGKELKEIKKDKYIKWGFILFYSHLLVFISFLLYKSIVKEYLISIISLSCIGVVCIWNIVKATITEPGALLTLKWHIPDIVLYYICIMTLFLGIIFEIS